MAGIIVQLLVSWLIVWAIEKRNLSVLGFRPSRERLTDFVVFFFITAFFCATDFFFRMWWAEQRWQLNPQLSFNLIASGIWWNIKSVFFEELIFRGVLLYILIRRTGMWKAIILSSVAFGIYHWFSHEVIGDPTQMIFTFITTGIMGLLYAYGYAKTFSLYIPFAIHLGWNLVRSMVFSETVIGDQLFIPVRPVPLVTISYFKYFVILLFPLLGALIVNFILLRKHRQAEML